MKLKLIAVALMTCVATVSLAQQPYPSRPIKVLVTIPPGGAPDIAARLLAQKMTESMGQPVLVENRTGANGNVAADILAKAPPDGYTLMVAADSLLTINPHVYAKMSFDPLKDLLPVASIASNQFFLSVNPSLPVKTVPELVELAKKTKPPLPYASGGNGSQHQLGIEREARRGGVEHRVAGDDPVDLLLQPGADPLRVIAPARRQRAAKVGAIGGFDRGLRVSHHDECGGAHAVSSL